MRHQVRSVAFDLLIRGDGAEDDFSKLPVIERPVGDPPNHLQRVLDYCYREMGSVVYQTGDIILGHLGELLLEDAFQTRHYNETFTFVIIVDHSEFDLAFALFDDGRLGTCELQWAQRGVVLAAWTYLLWKRNWLPYGRYLNRLWRVTARALNPLIGARRSGRLLGSLALMVDCHERQSQ
jgi:hypothetical protein